MERLYLVSIIYILKWGLIFLGVGISLFFMRKILANFSARNQQSVELNKKLDRIIELLEKNKNS